ncbi:unnamed protein product [Schistocephalus solidus]|uniref:ACB domain-containing protein n=1 Tax=Schistocephalus solidus TaxID=70667 RepID=A0A3P7ERC6_SCHSO|nr:unnamed protein product [Schistocephalus solidus]
MNVVLLSSVPNTFEEAKLALSKLRKEPDNDIKLKIYALFKQATEGNCTKQRPGRLDFINFAKWQAWSDLGKMTTKVASESYIKLIKQLLESESPSSAASDHAPTSEIDRQVDDTGVMRLTLNRPSKKNAITWTVSSGQKFHSTISDCVWRRNSCFEKKTLGAGDFFCSGNDLSNFAAATKPGADMQKLADTGKQVMQKFVASFIDFPKPLVGLINGPAVGIAVTTLPLYDCVLASDTATFHVPLTALGMTPEGCASYTFPRTMGTMRVSLCQLANFSCRVKGWQRVEIHFSNILFSPKDEE